MDTVRASHPSRCQSDLTYSRNEGYHERHHAHPPPSLADRCIRVCVSCRHKDPPTELKHHGTAPTTSTPTTKALGPWSAHWSACCLPTSMPPSPVTQYAPIHPNTCMSGFQGRQGCPRDRPANEQASRDPCCPSSPWSKRRRSGRRPRQPRTLQTRGTVRHERYVARA